MIKKNIMEGIIITNIKAIIIITTETQKKIIYMIKKIIINRM